MNSTLQPQLLKDETVKSGTTIQEELKSAILEMCRWAAQILLANGEKVQYATLREQVSQWDRSQQKWATSFVAGSSTDYQGASGC